MSAERLPVCLTSAEFPVCTCLTVLDGFLSHGLDEGSDVFISERASVSLLPDQFWDRQHLRQSAGATADSDTHRSAGMKTCGVKTSIVSLTVQCPAAS